MKHSVGVCLIGLLLLAPAAGFAKPKPITAKSQLLFGIDMAERGLWSEALFRFEQAERMGASGVAVYNNMAVAYEALGLFEKAREYYLRALDESPTRADLKRNYARFVEFYQSFKPEGEEDGAQTAGAEDESSNDGGDPASGR